MGGEHLPSMPPVNRKRGLQKREDEA